MHNGEMNRKLIIIVILSMLFPMGIYLFTGEDQELSIDAWSIDFGTFEGLSISGNYHLLSLAEDHRWPGNGTISNPIIMDNYTFVNGQESWREILSIDCV